jgi:hypothetical protein
MRPDPAVTLILIPNLLLQAVYLFVEYSTILCYDNLSEVFYITMQG